MKNKYELFNEINLNEKIEEESSLSDKEKEDIFDKLIKEINIKENYNGGEAENLHIDERYLRKDNQISNGINKKNYRKIAIASVLCLSIATVSLGNEKVWALVNSIGKQIESYLGKAENEYKGYKVAINQEVEDKGIKIKIYEALLDDGNILLSMNLDYSNFDEDKLLENNFGRKNYYLPNATVYMDGNKFVETGGATRNENTKDKSKDFFTSLDLKRVDTNGDNRADITDYQILENIDLDKAYDIKIVFDQVGVQKTGLIPKITKEKFEFIDGNWEFNFKVSGKEIMGETKVFNIDKEVKIDEKDFKALINIKQLRVSPISVKLTYTTKMGEDYEFENRDINIDLIDQDGNLINAGGGGGGNKDQTYMEWSMEGYLENNQELESIMILPYQYYRENGSNNPDKHHRIEYKNHAITINLKDILK